MEEMTNVVGSGFESSRAVERGVEIGCTTDISDHLLYPQVCACGNGRGTRSHLFANRLIEIGRVDRHIGVL